MEKHDIMYMATYEVQDFSRRVWVTVSGKFDCETVEEAEDAAVIAAANDPQATGRWSVSMHQQGKQYCYSRQVKRGYVDHCDIIDLAI